MSSAVQVRSEQFWEKVYLASVERYGHGQAVRFADSALQDWIKRFDPSCRGNAYPDAPPPPPPIHTETELGHVAFAGSLDEIRRMKKEAGVYDG